MKKILISIVILLVLLTSCAPGSDLEVTTPETTIELRSPGANPQLNQTDAAGRISGFVQGLWHGIIAPVENRPTRRDGVERDARGAAQVGADDARRDVSIANEGHPSQQRPFDLRLLLVPVGDIQQLHDIRVVVALAVLVSRGLWKSVAALPHAKYVLRQTGLPLDCADVLGEIRNIVVTHRTNH